MSNVLPEELAMGATSTDPKIVVGNISKAIMTLTELEEEIGLPHVLLGLMAVINDEIDRPGHQELLDSINLALGKFLNAGGARQ